MPLAASAAPDRWRRCAPVAASVHRFCVVGSGRRRDSEAPLARRRQPLRGAVPYRCLLRGVCRETLVEAPRRRHYGPGAARGFWRHANATVCSSHPLSACLRCLSLPVCAPGDMPRPTARSSETVCECVGKGLLGGVVSCFTANPHNQCHEGRPAFLSPLRSSLSVRPHLAERSVALERPLTQCTDGSPAQRRCIIAPSLHRGVTAWSCHLVALVSSPVRRCFPELQLGLGRLSLVVSPPRCASLAVVVSIPPHILAAPRPSSVLSAAHPPATVWLLAGHRDGTPRRTRCHGLAVL